MSGVAAEQGLLVPQGSWRQRMKKTDEHSPTHSNEARPRNEGSPVLRDASMQHPLECTWSMWYFKNDKNKDWKNNLKFIASCSTVEDFWALYNHLKSPASLQAGCDYSFFKDNIRPMWEDERNVEGGRWLVNLSRQQRSFELEKFWLEALLCLIGEAFDPHSDEICGVVVNIRQKGDKLAIWTACSDRKDVLMRIGHKIQQRLGLPPRSLEFQAHKDTITKSGSTTKKKFTI